MLTSWCLLPVVSVSLVSQRKDPGVAEPTQLIQGILRRRDETNIARQDTNNGHAAAATSEDDDEHQHTGGSTDKQTWYAALALVAEMSSCRILLM